MVTCLESCNHVIPMLKADPTRSCSQQPADDDDDMTGAMDVIVRFYPDFTMRGDPDLGWVRYHDIMALNCKP